MMLRYSFDRSYYVAGGFEHVLFFQWIGNIIIPTDELIFFRGVGQPPTRLCFAFHGYRLFSVDDVPHGTGALWNILHEIWQHFGQSPIEY